MNKKLMCALTACGAIVLSSIAYAHPLTKKPTGNYIGAGVNYNAIQKNSENNMSFKLDKEYMGYNLFAGQRLNKNFAHELGIQQLAKSEWKNSNTIIKNKNTYHAYYDAYMIMSIASYLDIFANGGISYITIDQEYNYTNSVNISHFRTVCLNYGAGVQLNLDNVTIRGRYTHLSLNKEITELDSINDLINLEVAYHLS